MTIESFGRDGNDDALACGANNYNGDCDTVVLASDYLVDLSSGISVTFKKPYTPAFGTCGFLALQASSFTTMITCENAGGSWDSGTSTCTTINASSCKSVGGKWKTCNFTPDQCATFIAGTGTTWQESCEYTENSCTASSGSWDSTNHVCTISSTTCPGASCTHTTSNACMDDKGVWVKRCVFNDSTSCTSSIGSGGANATFDSTNKPDSCVFTSAECEVSGGITDARDCHITHAEGEAVLTRYTEKKCQLSSKGSWFKNTTDNGWSFEKSSICLKVFHRLTDTTIGGSYSEPVVVEENGSYQTINFSNFSSLDIPLGTSAIGVYRYDGSSCNSSNELYPNDLTSPISIQFIPHTNLPIINW